MRSEIEEAPLKPKRPTPLGKFRFHQFMKHLIALAVTGLVVMRRFDEELGVPDGISKSIIVLLFTAAYIFRNRIYNIRNVLNHHNRRKFIVKLLSISGLISSVCIMYYGVKSNNAMTAGQKIILWFPMLPITYSIVINMFEFHN